MNGNIKIKPDREIERVRGRERGKRPKINKMLSYKT